NDGSRPIPRRSQTWLQEYSQESIDQQNMTSYREGLVDELVGAVKGTLQNARRIYQTSGLIGLVGGKPEKVMVSDDNNVVTKREEDSSILSDEIRRNFAKVAEAVDSDNNISSSINGTARSNKRKSRNKRDGYDYVALKVRNGSSSMDTMNNSNSATIGNN